MRQEILLLGDVRLYEKSEEIKQEELESIKELVIDLRDTLFAYREKYGAGRAIAAPQIGVAKRLLYMNIGDSIAFVNPTLIFPNAEKMEVLDDCMSFPGLYVDVMRYKTCIINYRDLDWNLCEMTLVGDLAELLQHEYDHLDGILATMRARDNKSFHIKSN